MKKQPKPPSKPVTQPAPRLLTQEELRQVSGGAFPFIQQATPMPLAFPFIQT
jgi:hypothetical protein